MKSDLNALATDIDPQNAERITQIIQRLTVEEKVRMLSGDLDFWPGLNALMQEDYYHTHPFPAAVCEREGLSGLHFIDGPRGVVLEGGATSFPVSMARGASWDVDLEERIGDAIGKELRAFGGTLFGGVCINLLRHPAWGRAQETFGEDPMHLGAMGAALVRGVEHHANACIKHYALNSMENARFSVDVKIDPRPLHEVYLPHFKDCVDAGASSVMSAYNAMNGEWCGQNAPLLRDILKERWGFKGYVLTDFVFGMRDAKKAIENGLDLEMPYRMIWGKELLRLIKQGQVDESLLDEPLIRLISPQLKMPQSDTYNDSVKACQAHRDLAREAATKSIVMLKNEDGVLPLSKDKKLAVIGPLAAQANLGDHGSSDGRPKYVITPLDGLRAQLGDKVSYSAALDSDEDKQKVRDADAVLLVVGYTYEDEGEYVAPDAMSAFAGSFPPIKGLGWMASNPLTKAIWAGMARFMMNMHSRSLHKKAKEDGAAFGIGGDRDSLNLSVKDEALIKAACALNKKVVVAVMSGSAVMMEKWKDDVASILMIWYPGMEGGHALADIVLGHVSPSGKLPFTVPTSQDHLPYFDKNATEITYDYWHGYKKLERDGHAPAFPFGFGLSYSEFEYSKLKLGKKNYTKDETLSISLNVKNIGSVAADEIVQLYIKTKNSKVYRAEKDLKAFERISLDAGKAQTVKFELPVAKLAYFDETADDFVVEATDYEIILARYSLDDEALRQTITVKAI